MRTLAWTLFTMSVCAWVVYAIVMWLLGVPMRSVRSLWHEAQPVDDHGEPYESWARTMESGRQTQMREEED